jgi:hypothetical protein
MEPTPHYRPRVSRETRRLMAAGAIAVAALWLLARFRFDERPLTANPVPAVLSQLAAPPSYDDLAQTIGQVQSWLEPSLLVVDANPDDVETESRRPALRLHDDLAVVLLPDASARAGTTSRPLVARDPSGLAVVRVPGGGGFSPPVAWTPRRERQPRYFVATDVSAAGVSLRPVFVGALEWTDSPWWTEPVWAVPASAGLTAGAFVFASNAELVGVVATSGAALVIVPGAGVLAAAARLLQGPPGAPGQVGLDVQALTAPLAALTGATRGVVVTRAAAPDGADSPLRVGDVIEAVNGELMTTRQHWDARMARLRAGESLSLRVRRGGEVLAVPLTAAALPAPPDTLGLGLQRLPSQGTEVTRVDPGSAGARAGLQPGDVVTLVAEIPAPTPSQLTRAFTALEPGQRVMLAMTRAGIPHVLVLER